MIPTSMFLQSQPQAQTQRQSYDDKGSECSDEDLDFLSVTGCAAAFVAIIDGFLRVVDDIGVLPRG